MVKGKSRVGNRENSYHDSPADINPLTPGEQTPYSQKLNPQTRNTVYPKPRKDKNYSRERDLSSAAQNKSQYQLIKLIDDTLKRGRPTQITRQILERKKYKEADRGILYEEIANSIYEFSGNEGEVAHLRHLRACLTGEEDFFIGFYSQMKRDEYSDIARALKETKHQKVDFSDFKSELSPKKPLELLILDAINFAENNGTTHAEVEVNLEGRRDEDAASERYVEELIELLEGKKAYRVFVACLRDGSTKTNIRILK